jgi:hypothetical protein
MVEESTAAARSLSQETGQLAGLIGQFKVGRESDHGLRQELQKVAPHAFRQSAKPTKANVHVVGSSGSGAPKHSSKKRVANGASVGDQSGQWEEF